ncbi:hypothetical protein CAEBREN_30674 [Caenorhabditis brenneri]|uniref:Uncharacterized protein n=1 Tax=Caenorhabditis brenneri TaxID=135651 RepID=G0N8P2_CAEBE|nr:hypothetical protein CAEBREN_30674 [Caenorhabditis brenneri]
MPLNGSSCTKETYFDTAEFLNLYSHLTSIIALPVNILGIWLIYRKTPVRMKNMKGVMLNCHVWGLFGDVMLGTLTIPYVFFPVISGAPLGILTRFFDINAFFQTYIAVACVAEVGSSIVFMFENRQNQTVTSSWKITSEKGRKAFYIINLVFPWLSAVISLLRIPDQVWAKLEMLKTIPCPTIEFFQLPVIIVTTDAKSIGLALLLLLLFYAIQILFFIVHSSFYLCISTKSYAVSEKTKKLKRKYFVAVCIQIMIPFAIMAVPVNYYAFSIITDYYNQSKILRNLNFF